MKTLKEIFADKPELLEEKEIKEFVDEFHKQYAKLRLNFFQYHDRVSDIALMAIVGDKKAEDVIQNILDLEFKTV